MFFSDDEGKLSEGYKIFSERFGFCPREDIFVRAASENKIEKENGKITFFYTDRLSFFRALFCCLAAGRTKISPSAFKRTGIMLDCARNGVPSLSFLKDFVLSAIAAGYDYLGLYVEDCIEVEEEPHFGYMRGRYTEGELKEIVAFADLFGFEIMPFVQTLAHLGLIFRHWDPYYKDARDFGDILLMDEPRVYRLIDRLFHTVRKCFGACRVNVGMDEAFMMARGKYRELHGDKDPAEVFFRHVRKVCELAAKYGLSPEAWADMFVRNKDKAVIPENLTLRAWEYSLTDEKAYSDMIAGCKAMTDKVSFGSGVHKWYGTVPLNEFSETAFIPAIKAAKGKCDDFLVTLWGDDGAECSHNAVWYSLLKIANAAAGEPYNEDELNEAATTITGHDAAELLALDLPNKVFDGKADKPVNVSKYLLYEDVFYGNADFAVSEKFVPYFVKAKNELTRLAEKGGILKEIYEEEAALSAVLEKKCGIRNRLRAAYKKDDKEELLRLSDRLLEIKSAVAEFLKAAEKRWLKDNKAFGAEILTIRLGGLIARLDFCARRVKAYAAGEIEEIEELAQTDLSPAPAEDNYAAARAFNSYEQNVSYCNIVHKLYN